MMMTICEGSGHEDQPPAIRIQQQQLRSARKYRLVFQDQVAAPVLGIRDIVGRIRPTDPDPHLTPDLTPFFRDFKDAQKKQHFNIFFLLIYTQAQYSIFSVLKIKFFAKIWC
jgi:hypothetical protein